MRNKVIAVVMLALFLVSIGLASLTTGTDRVVVAGLSLSVPQYWEGGPRSDRLASFFQTLATFHPHNDERYRLDVGALRFNTEVTPDAAFQHVQRILRFERTKTQPNQIHVGNLVGWEDRFSVVSRSHLSMHMVAVVTDNGRDYWMIRLNKIIHLSQVGQRPPYPRALFNRIVQSARHERRRT